VGLQLAEEFAGKRILDYGSGDGSFLAMLMNGQARPAIAVGAELQSEVVEDCRARLGTLPGLSFVVNEGLETAKHQGVYDAVVCMEVLEHVLEIRPLLDRFVRLLSPSGKLLISVPVETGLPLLVKETVRRFAGWRGIGDYPGTTSYTVGEFATSVFATGKRQHIVRPIHKNADGSGSHDHKGFNWMILREILTQMFEIEKVVGSPLDWLTPHLASQVWFLVRRKA
jgi:SAM-dependent methyltransferase